MDKILAYAIAWLCFNIISMLILIGINYIYIKLGYNAVLILVAITSLKFTLMVRNNIEHKK